MKDGTYRISMEKKKDYSDDFDAQFQEIEDEMLASGQLVPDDQKPLTTNFSDIQYNTQSGKSALNRKEKKMINHGELSYEDAASETSNRSEKVAFMRLKEGNNVLRFISLPHKYHSHSWKPEGTSGYGTKICCTAELGSCDLCAADVKVDTRFYYLVIDRETDTVKLLDVGTQLFNKLKDLAQNKFWGDPQTYDVAVVRNKAAGPSGFYNVVPAGSKGPLSVSDQVLRDACDTSVLAKRCTPDFAFQAVMMKKAGFSK